MQQFKLLNEIKVEVATSKDKSFDNVRKNMNRNYTFIHNMHAYSANKGNLPIALVGGGPSIKDHIEELKNFQGVIVACGSPHDWMISNGIFPHYTILCDPDPITANYLTNPQGTCIYLVATQCDEVVFDKLKANAVYLWHCFNNDIEAFKELDPNFQAIGGGCTVGMRALSIVLLMGYSNVHLFGFDSCLGDDDSHHAYGFSTSVEELGTLYEVKLDPDCDKMYKAAGYQIAQVQDFKDMYMRYNNMFTPVFHGNGLLPDMMANINLEIAKQTKEMTNG